MLRHRWYFTFENFWLIFKGEFSLTHWVSSVAVPVNPIQMIPAAEGMRPIPLTDPSALYSQLKATYTQPLYFHMPLTAQWQGRFLTSMWLNYPPLTFPHYYLLNLAIGQVSWVCFFSGSYMSAASLFWTTLLCFCPGESPCLLPLWSFVQASWNSCLCLPWLDTGYQYLYLTIRSNWSRVTNS